MTRRSLVRGPGVAWPGCYEAGWVAATGTQLAGTGNGEPGTGNRGPLSGRRRSLASLGMTPALSPVASRQSPVACRLVFRHLPTSGKTPTFPGSPFANDVFDADSAGNLGDLPKRYTRPRSAVLPPRRR